MVKLQVAGMEMVHALVDGKFHIPTIERVFKLRNIELNGRIASDGMTLQTFEEDMTVTLTGEPAGDRSNLRTGIPPCARVPSTFMG